MTDEVEDAVKWIPISNAAEIVAARYDAEEERIYVRFYYQVEWWYGECSQQTWQMFMVPGESVDKYVDEVLKLKPNGRAGILWGSP